MACNKNILWDYELFHVQYSLDYGGILWCNYGISVIKTAAAKKEWNKEKTWLIFPLSPLTMNLALALVVLDLSCT